MNNTVKITLAALSGIALGYAIGRYLPPLMEELKEGIEEEQKELQRMAARAAKSTAPIQKKEQVLKDEPKQQVELPEVAEGFPLQLGSKGHEVERVQIFLMRKLGFVRPPTSIFDHITLSRVESWFKEKEISQELYEKLKLDKMLHDQRKIK